MGATTWILPVVILVAILTTATYFMGRKHNVLLMRVYANALEEALRPVDQTYTWVGGYVGFKADYKVKDDSFKAVKATLHLMPRVSLMYYPVARFTMRHDKLYLVFESKQSIPGEGHLIKKGQYRFVPPGIENEEQFRQRDVTLGGVEYRLLYLDSRGEKALLRWADALKIPDHSLVKHLSFTSSTNVVYAYVEPSEELIASLVRTAPDVVKSLAK